MSFSQGTLVVKNLPANSGDIRDPGSIPGLGRSPEEGNGNPLQYSWLENPHGKRSLVGYSPWGLKESDMVEHTHTHLEIILHCVVCSNQMTKWNHLPEPIKVCCFPGISLSTDI